ncbi:energy transducer TonB [Brenneria uluponensis]|uniref:energy transducer TonB n=1 Tax=Brenneria uluponensis TaxID=3057057 RepID=UPI0028E42446|nr:energy transducer TonB [Brenneria ulupoensis]
MTSFILDTTPRIQPPFSKERLLWVISPALAIGIHLLLLLYILQNPSQLVNAQPSPVAAPIVVTMAAVPATSQLYSYENVARQERVPDEATLPPSVAKLDAAEKEVKNADVKAVVHDAKPLPKVEPKPKLEKKLQRVKHDKVKPQPKKIEVKKPSEVTAIASTLSNNSDRLSQHSQAPQVGAESNNSTAMKQSWQSIILARLQRAKRYPGYALHMKQQDTVMVRFVIDRDGKVLDSSIVKSQGYASLDREALQLLERVSPLPKPPSSAFDRDSDRMELVVPISFVIRNG